jgi:hypothetical protein
MRKAKTPSALTDEFNEPIVVPFRGMFKSPDGTPSPPSLLGRAFGLPPSDEPTVNDLVFDGLLRRFAKLLRLAQHHNIDDLSGPGGLHLALRIAMDYHPGFKLVYDDPMARLFHRLHGFTPIYPLKGNAPQELSGTDRGWPHISKILIPETLAMLIPRDRKSKLTDRELCELFVVAADEEMKKRKNLLTKNQRTATLVRRLTKGRKHLKNEE